MSIAARKHQIKLTPTDVTVEKFVAKFFNAEFSLTGNVASVTTTPVIRLAFSSNAISLKPWSQLVPMLKAYELEGTAKASGHVSGTTDALKYDAVAGVSKVTLKAPKFKTNPRIDGSIKIVTDQIQDLNVTLQGPGNDLKIRGKLVSFSKPKLELTASSTGMDLDQWIEFPKKESTDKPRSSPTAAPAVAKSAAPPAEDYDALLDPLRKNAIVAAAQSNFHLNLAFVKAYNVRMNQLSGEVSLKGLTLLIEKFRMGLFDGTVVAKAGMELRPKAPTYQFDGAVDKLDMKQAVASQFEMFKNTVYGNASFKIDGNGASFNPDAAKSNLHAKGNMKIDKATFATLDVGKVAVDAIHKALGDIASKVPNLKEQMVKPLDQQGKYEYVSSDFSISKGVFSAPHFVAKAEPNRGIDLHGTTTLGIKDYQLNADWVVVDTYDILGIRNLSVEQSGVRVEHILSDGGPVQFPIKVGGTAFSPVVDYGKVADVLGQVVLANVAKGLAAKAQSEVLNQVSAPKEVQDALQDLGKHLFGH